ncbi:MAG: hypothetical protein MJA30_14740, partial [Cytophagales bacterium]|nr:hypothetical protein [Cytophagales bacterium]
CGAIRAASQGAPKGKAQQKNCRRHGRLWSDRRCPTQSDMQQDLLYVRYAPVLAFSYKAENNLTFIYKARLK